VRGWTGRAERTQTCAIKSMDRGRGSNEILTEAVTAETVAGIGSAVDAGRHEIARRRFARLTSNVPRRYRERVRRAISGTDHSVQQVIHRMSDSWGTCR
jgi:hypothetical protein